MQFGRQLNPQNQACLLSHTISGSASCRIFSPFGGRQVVRWQCSAALQAAQMHGSTVLPSCRLFNPQKRRQHARHCTALQALKRIPIFPLGLVALPTVQTPLNIFEARYRVLFSTLLAGENGIDEYLVQDDSPFKGSKEFGICYVHKEGMAAVGTVVSIQHHEVYEDGRMYVVSEGTQRFAVQDVVQSRPVVVADCEMLPEPEDDGEDEESRQLADNARELVHAVLQLRQKLDKMPSGADPADLQSLPPRALSYWIASLFVQDMYFQQLQLQAPDTEARLKSAIHVLEQLASQFRAMVALEGLGQQSPSSESADDPADPSDAEGSSGDAEDPSAERGPDQPSS